MSRSGPKDATGRQAERARALEHARRKKEEKRADEQRARLRKRINEQTRIGGLVETGRNLLIYVIALIAPYLVAAYWSLRLPETIEGQIIKAFAYDEKGLPLELLDDDRPWFRIVPATEDEDYCNRDAAPIGPKIEAIRRQWAPRLRLASAYPLSPASEEVTAQRLEALRDYTVCGWVKCTKTGETSWSGDFIGSCRFSNGSDRGEWVDLGQALDDGKLFETLE